MSSNDRIYNELAAIEKKENLTILLAVESGSRAWGFASPDSDYDVRFIYVRPQEHYLRLDKTRDVCEWMQDNILDINGWDFDKTLRLLYSSNPTLFEWMNSPIVYRRHPAFIDLMKNANEYFLSKPGLHHYLHMAEGNYREYLKGDTVKLKKYFYVLRPILACRHILSFGTPPPMLFHKLVESQMEPSLVPEIMELLKIKEITSEMGLASKHPRLNGYIEESLEYLKAEADRMPPQPKQSWEQLNDIFLKSLMITNRIRDIRVERWAHYESIRDELPECDDCPAYDSAIKEAALKGGIRYTGEEHQNESDGIPIFNDGTYALYSMRAWGDLMADVWSEADGQNYTYMDFYM